MASPQQFLAQAQARRAPSLAVPTKLSLPKSIPAPAEEPASNPLPPHPQQGKQAQVEAALEKPKNEKTSPAAAAVPGTPTPASRKPSGQKSILAKDEILVKPAGSIKTSQLSSKESKSPDNTGFTPGSIDRQEDDSNSDNAPTKIEALTGVLLEIESTFDTADSPDTSKDPLSSPGIEQLTGLNFYVEPSQEDSVTLSKDTPAFSDVVRQAQDAKKRVEALQADLNASGGDSKFDAEAAEERAKQAWEVVETCYQAMQNYFAAVNSKRLSGMQPSSPQVYKLDPVNTSPETPRGIPVTLSQPVLDEIVNQPSNATLHTSSQPLADETINQVSNAKLQTPPKPLADSFKEYRSPPRTPSSQDSKEDMASEKSLPHASTKQSSQSSAHAHANFFQGMENAPRGMEDACHQISGQCFQQGTILIQGTRSACHSFSGEFDQ
ncbi:uncharacterized protein N7483_007142 [Penicillium malachiteum]|uniref:uncharacterized protein n=1 Tax=Penicillium malachiteum TaxID=1324776 RepID=UPI002546A4B2|nr:uncharacterized protein N7483_007142 [Penicillium malachiteum]KAJ5725785.1 hypothetical protein N7483_007142 [Penicillium malachiteum]